MTLDWPAVALLLGLVGFLLFRNPIARLIDRTRRISKTGLDADAQQQGTQVEVKPSAAEELQKLFDNELLVRRENEVRAQLQQLAFKDLNEREKFLVRLVAASSIIQAFERAYASIWGSQLGALQVLNSAGLQGAPLTLLRPWYDQAVAGYPAVYAVYSFEQWLAFMQSSLLLRREGDQVYITLEGREFLKYVVHQGYSLFKAA